MKLTVNDWKALSLFKKIGVLATLVGLIVAVYSGHIYFNDLTRDTVKQIVIFNKKTHLGDNDQERFGATSSPFVEYPDAEQGAHLLIYNKKEKSFVSANGFPAEVQNLLNFYSGRYQGVNLSAYKHVLGVKPSGNEGEQYPGSSVQIDPSTKLVWVENAGNFYHEKAAVGITSTVNLFQYLKENGFAPDKTKIKKAIFWYHGLHSEKQQGQLDNVEVVINGKIYPVKFESSESGEEFVAVKIQSRSLNLTPDSINRFTIMVSPYQEKYPIPQPTAEKYKKVGPGHFRDIELWKGVLELVID